MVVAFLSIFVITPNPVLAAITCQQVTVAVTPCIGYARTGGTMPPDCCNGVRNLNSAAKNTPDRQQACICLKQMSSIPGINMSIVSEIPAKCNVNIGYPIAMSTDCSKVK
uniref:Non-specific lipid-transfer protein n=1 Tax=Lilium longiflorum TaxID=4690 RepID=B2BA83_LILLO|nr:lipid transfer protein [Lilium longiflorum]